MLKLYKIKSKSKKEIIWHHCFISNKLRIDKTPVNMAFHYLYIEGKRIEPPYEQIIDDWTTAGTYIKSSYLIKDGKYIKIK